MGHRPKWKSLSCECFRGKYLQDVGSQRFLSPQKVITLKNKLVKLNFVYPREMKTCSQIVSSNFFSPYLYPCHSLLEFPLPIPIPNFHMYKYCASLMCWFEEPFPEQTSVSSKPLWFSFCVSLRMSLSILVLWLHMANPQLVCNNFPWHTVSVLSLYLTESFTQVILNKYLMNE